MKEKLCYSACAACFALAVFLPLCKDLSNQTIQHTFFSHNLNSGEKKTHRKKPVWPHQLV